MMEDKGLWMGMVKIGEKGQIVIPKPVRDMFELRPGMSILLMADTHRGIALVREEEYRDFLESKLSGVPIESTKQEADENGEA